DQGVRDEGREVRVVPEQPQVVQRWGLVIDERVVLRIVEVLVGLEDGEDHPREWQRREEREHRRKRVEQAASGNATSLYAGWRDVLDLNVRFRCVRRSHISRSLPGARAAACRWRWRSARAA